MATSAPDLTPLGIATARWSFGIATMKPLGGVVVPALVRSTVSPVHRLKNLMMYETWVDFWTAVK